MQKKILVIGIGAAVAASLALVPTVMAKQTPRTERGHTIKLVERTNLTSIDLGAPGPSAGDQFAGDNRLFDQTGNTQVGNGRGLCVQVGESATVLYCTATLQLPDGDIAVQGVIDSSESDFTLSITGGTDKYRGVQGQLVGAQVDATTLSLSVELSKSAGRE